MRIIGGILRGRKLLAVRSKAVRPTSDRVREALFNILGARTDDAKVLDLFAGTGALGIEALSRHAHSAVFIDSSAAAMQTIRRNIAQCGLQSKSRMITWDIVKSLKPLYTGEHRFDLIFIDPPYHRQMVLPALSHLAKCQLVAPDAVVVIEQDAAERLDPLSPCWSVTDHRRYGQTQLTFLALRAHA